MDRRIYFLDQVRSHMMLLGIVLHAAGSYNNLPAGELWPYKSVDVHIGYSVLINLIHSFRMQVFFLVAGLFAAMLLSKRGSTGFLKHRTQRVLLPLLIFAGPLMLSCNWLFAYGAELMHRRGTIIEFSDSVHLYHLWFLYYLYIYVLLAIPLQGVLIRCFSEGRNRYVAKVLPWMIGILIALVHFAEKSYLLEVPVGLNVFKGVFFQYFLFFAAGMMAFHLREEFFASVDRCWRLLAFAVLFLIMFVASVAMNAAQNEGDPNAIVWYGMIFLGLYYAFACWFVLAIYKRLCDHFSPVASYLSEASYWVYLVHLPMTVALPMLIDDWQLHHVVKFGVVLLVTLFVSLLTFHLFARSTWIGWLLNGKRRRFNLPFIHKPEKFMESKRTA